MPLCNPNPIYNVDGTWNPTGSITHKVELIVKFQGHHEKITAVISIPTPICPLRSSPSSSLISSHSPLGLCHRVVSSLCWTSIGLEPGGLRLDSIYKLTLVKFSQIWLHAPQEILIVLVYCRLPMVAHMVFLASSSA